MNYTGGGVGVRATLAESVIPALRTDDFVRLTLVLCATSARHMAPTSSGIPKSIFKPRSPVYLATFNVRILRPEGQQVALALTRNSFGIDLCCISESGIQDAYGVTPAPKQRSYRVCLELARPPIRQSCMYRHICDWPSRYRSWPCSLSLDWLVPVNKECVIPGISSVCGPRFLNDRSPYSIVIKSKSNSDISPQELTQESKPTDTKAETIPRDGEAYVVGVHTVAAYPKLPQNPVQLSEFMLRSHPHALSGSMVSLLVQTIHPENATAEGNPVIDELNIVVPHLLVNNCKKWRSMLNINEGPNRLKFYCDCSRWFGVDLETTLIPSGPGTTDRSRKITAEVRIVICHGSTLPLFGEISMQPQVIPLTSTSYHLCLESTEKEKNVLYPLVFNLIKDSEEIDG
ncbi:hypothetical protein CLF_110977 [Clonorchis sinensis]|uniref:Uncharacterized protein n=1 Tax=Clonorchis sinensis TaxID=79923 RepID=G7YU51_CLOSI|nr:hypothetical protein CLF_110977 [Clonorchis sinensis]